MVALILLNDIICKFYILNIAHVKAAEKDFRHLKKQKKMERKLDCP